jgi:hypothetical protein
MYHLKLKKKPVKKIKIKLLRSFKQFNYQVYNI